MVLLTVTDTLKNNSSGSFTIPELNSEVYYLKYVQKEEHRAKILLIALPICFIIGLCTIIF